jgi:hypothetical protein
VDARSLINTGSVQFNGSQYLTLPSNTAFSFGTNNLTIECWWKANGTQINYAPVIGQSFTSSPTTGSYDLKVSGSTSVVEFTYYNTGTTSLVNIDGTTNVNDGNWHHIAVSRNNLSLYVFVDGTLQTTATLPSGQIIGLSSSSPIIGYTSRDGYLNGIVSNLRILNGTSLYTSNFTPPTSPLTAIANTVLLTCQDTTGSTVHDNSNNNFTITTTGSPTITTTQPGFANGWYFGANSNNYLILGTSNTTVTCISTTPLVSNAWNYVATSRSNGAITIWQNGSATSQTILNNTDNMTAANVLIGQTVVNPTANTGWKGYISNLRIENGTAIYSVGNSFVLSNTALTPISNTTLLTCNQLPALSGNNFLYDNSVINNQLTLMNANVTSNGAMNQFVQPTNFPTNTSWTHIFTTSGTFTA